MAKILVVDDSAFARNLLKMIIERGGHEIIGYAKDGESAFDLYKDLNPGLVTLDYLMDGKNGQATLEKILQYDPDAKVVMVSGSGDHEVAERARQTGARGFVAKPFLQKVLLKVIDEAVAA